MEKLFFGGSDSDSSDSYCSLFDEQVSDHEQDKNKKRNQPPLKEPPCKQAKTEKTVEERLTELETQVQEAATREAKLKRRLDWSNERLRDLGSHVTRKGYQRDDQVRDLRAQIARVRAANIQLNVDLIQFQQLVQPFLQRPIGANPNAEIIPESESEEEW